MNETDTPAAGDTPDAIDAYLDALLARLTVRPERVRRIITESEDHLREAAAAGMARGLDVVEAQRDAIEAFGAPSVVARRFAAEEGVLLPPSLLLHLVLAMALMGSVGFAAIGVSGLVAQGMGSIFGVRFVSGDHNGVTYTPARCADFQKYYPGTCEEAATAHHFDEMVDSRITAGVLGLLGLGVLFAIRRSFPRGSGVRRLPSTFTPTVGAALFGIAAAGMLLQSLAQLSVAGRIPGEEAGVGAVLSAGIVSLIVFVGYATALVRRLRAA